MRLFLIPFVTIMLVSGCFLTGDPDPFCNSSVAQFPDDRVLESISYQDGDMLRFRSLDGGVIVAAASRSFAEFPRRDAFCLATLTVTVAEQESAGPFHLEAVLEGPNGGGYGYALRTRSGVEDNFGISIQRSFSEPFEIVPDRNQRIIPDTVLNGRRYELVLEQRYQPREEADLERVYWNAESGFLQFVHQDGFVISLEE